MIGVIDLLLNIGSDMFSNDPVYVNRRGTGSRNNPYSDESGTSNQSVLDTPSEDEFTVLGNNLLSALQSDIDSTDYSYLFDDVTDLTPRTPDTGIGSFDISDVLRDDNLSYLFDDVTDLTPNFTPGTSFDAQSLIDNMFGIDPINTGFVPTTTTTTTAEEVEPDTGPLGGTLGPTLRKYFLGSEDDPGFLEEFILGKASSKDGGGGRTGGAAGLLTGGDGGILSSPLLKLILANYLSKKDEGPSGLVPIGQQAFAAGGQGLSSMPDYRVFNIQPALMPGVAYANAPPPEMKHGGVHGAGKDDGPGDITLARLEPGEFVMTRKATENLGARNLYKLMKQAEGMG